MKKPNLSLNVPQEKVADKVLLTPDTESCIHVAETYFKDAVRFNENKNFFGCTGTYLGKRLTVINAGIGMESVGLLAEELYDRYNVESIVLLGLCDGLREEILPRQYLLAEKALFPMDSADEEGACDLVEVPADKELNDAIAADFASRKGLTNFVYESPVLHRGAVLTDDRRITDPEEAKQWAEEPDLLAADLSAAALLEEAAIRTGKRAAALFVVDRNVLSGEEMLDKEFQRVTMRQIVLAMANL